MHRFAIILLSPLAVGLVTTACGGVAGESLFGGSSAGGSGGASATSSSASGSGPSTTQTSTSSGSTGSSSTSSGLATSSSGSTSSSTGSATSSTSSSSSTSSTGATSSSSTSSSSGGTTGVYCDGNPCTTGQICCFNPNSAQPPDQCGNAGQCGQGYVEVSCSGPSDCPGKVCCAHYNVINTGMQSRLQYTGISCATSCNGNNETPLCTGDATVCPQGTQCINSGELGTPYQLCFN